MVKRKAQPKAIRFPVPVVIDTRERLPYSFEGFVSDADQGRKPLIVPTVTETLRTGDYSLKGFEDRVLIERKSKKDLYGTLGQGRDRFVRELERLSSASFAVVVVEAGWKEILEAPPSRCELKPKTIFRSVNAWEMRYPVRWRFVESRRLGEVTTFRILERFYKEFGERK